MRASWLNEYTGLFIKTLIEKERFKYNYGRSFKMDFIKQTKILLPIDEETKPNWNYIENFIKGLPFADRI